MPIRPARVEDAEAIADVLRRSIRELCVADHGGQGPVLDGWLANKRADEVRRWLGVEGDLILVAVDAQDAVQAVGALRRPDEVMLNYVAPEARFRGESRAMMAALEDALRAGGARRVRLTSTRTAERFYRGLGYVGVAAGAKLGMDNLDMVKELQP